jgi:hypothetical protein
MTRLWKARPVLPAVIVAPLALGVPLAGCGLTPQGQAIRQTIAEEGRAAAAAGLENAEWYICRASPVGAVVDRYGASETQWQAWSTLCLDRTAAVAERPLPDEAPDGAQASE